MTPSNRPDPIDGYAGAAIVHAGTEPATPAPFLSQLTRAKMLSTGSSLLIWQVCTVISGILVARALGPEGKGIVAAALVWPQVGAWVLLLGLNTASSVRVSENRGSLDHLLGNAVVYSLCVGLVGMVAGLWFLPGTLDHLGPGAAEAAQITVLVIPLVMLSEIIGGINLGLGRTRHYNAARVGSGVIVLVTTVALVWTGAETPQSLTAAGCLVGVAGLVVGAHGLPWRRVVVAVRDLRSDIAYGLRVFLTSLLAIVGYRLDLLVMSAFLEGRQIGFYSLATSAMLPIALVYQTAASLIMPSIAKARGARAGESGSDLSLIRRTALRCTLITLAVAMAMAVALPFVVPLVFGDAFKPTVVLAWILLPGYVATSCAVIIDAGLVGMRKPWVGNMSQGAGVLVTLCLLPLALPAYEAQGAAAVSSLAYLASAVTAVWGASRVYRTRTEDTPTHAKADADVGGV